MKTAYSDRHIVCPHCDYEHEVDVEDYEDHETEVFECGDCEKKFFVTIEEVTEFKSEADCVAGGEDHDWSTDKKETRNHIVGDKNSMGETYYQCLKCEQTKFE